MTKKKISVILFILLLAVAGFAACSSSMPSIYENMRVNNGRFSVFFLVEDKLNVIPPQNVEPDTVITLPDLEIEGNYFWGWSAYDPSDPHPMLAGSEYTVKASVVLYAVLEIDNTRLVVYDVKGDVFLVRSDYCTKGTQINLPKATVASHTFKGWSKESPDSRNPIPANSLYTVTEDTTFYAVLEKNPPPYATAIVQFSIDGTIDAGLTRVVEAGSTINLPSVSQSLEQKFVGWVSSEDTIGAIRPAGSVFVANRNIVLYAKYTSMQVVIFDIEGRKDLIRPAIVSPGSSITLPSGDYDEYEIVGWSEKGSDDPYPLPAGSVYYVEKDVILYAVVNLKSIVSFDVIVNGINYNDNDENVPKMYVINGSLIVLPDLKTPVSGYTLLGWKTNPQNTAYSTVGSSEIIYSDTVFFAVMHAEYNISFEVYYKGENLNPYYNNPASMTVLDGEQIRMPAFEHDIAGYTFLGWQDKSTETVYAEGERLVPVKNMVLSALLTVQSVINFEVTLNGVDYNEDDSNVPSMSVDTGSSITLPNLKTPVAGYTLLGWSETGANDSNPLKAGSAYSVGGDKTFYAVLGELATVSFNVGSVFNTVNPVTVLIGESITLPAPTLKLNNYRFAGWSLNPSPAVQTPLTGPYAVTETVTLYAISVERVEVSFIFKQETSTVLSKVVYDINTEITLIDPTLRGYDLIGWTLNQNLIGTVYAPNSKYTVGVNTTFYAKVESVWVSTEFSVNGSIIPSLTEDTPLDTSINLPDPILPDYILLGWTTDENGEGELLAPLSPYIAAQDAVLYAKLVALTEDYSFTVCGFNEYLVTGFSGNASRLTIPSVCDDGMGGGGNVVGIGASVFESSDIVSVTLPASIKYIGDFAFKDASKLESINLENVEIIGEGAFFRASMLKISSLNTINLLTDIGDYAFAFASTDAPDNTTAFVLTPNINNIGKYVFSGWTADMSVNIIAVNKKCENYDGDWATGNVGLIISTGSDFTFAFDSISGGYAVTGYRGSSQIVVIPEQIYIGRYYKVTAIADNAFLNNSANITKVVMGAEIVSIGKDAFKGNTSLSTVIFGGRVVVADIAYSFSGTAWYYQQIA